jgi:hypothetical protein
VKASAHMPRWQLLLAGAGLVLAGAGACGDDSQGECSRDDQCAADSACVSHVCVARMGPEPQRWNLEVAPKLETAYAARELPELPLARDRVTLEVDREVAMSVRIGRQAYEPADMPSSVHVVLSVASTISGRRGLQFEGDGVSTGAGQPYEAKVALPLALIGRSARMTVVPLAPLDRWMPPWALELLVAESSSIALPGPGGTLTLEGSVEAPPSTSLESAPYDGRLFIRDRLVSNVARTDPTGKLLLRVQRSVAQGAAEMRLELGPSDRAQALATVAARIAPGQTNLPSLRIPPFPTPVGFVIPVMAADDGSRVTGAAVRFATVIESGSNGETRYVRVAQTGADGNAAIPLVPGSTGQTRDYVVTVIPPADSALGALCLATYSVGSAVTESPRVGAVIGLPRRVVARGRLLSSKGRPAAMVLVRATRQGNLFKPECGGDLASPPTETMSDASGRYRLMLDPGDYRLEYVPPRGAALPMMVEERVSVVEPLDREVTLPEPVLVEGRVVGPGGEAVGDAEVRAFGKDAAGDIQLQGLASSGPDGVFRLVLPRRF